MSFTEQQIEELAQACRRGLIGGSLHVVPWDELPLSYRQDLCAAARAVAERAVAMAKEAQVEA